MGVAFFFVLSGFSMTLGYKDKVLQPAFKYKEYIKRRCIKFYPLHWLCLLVSIPLVGIPMSLKQGGIFVLNASLLQTLFPIKELFFSYNAVSWYLADTLFLALLYPFLLKFVSSVHEKRRMLIIIILVYAIMVILLPQEQYHAFLYICPFTRVADFMLGIILALGYLKMKENDNNSLFFKRSAICSCVLLTLVFLLVIEAFIIDKPIRYIAVVYWPLVSAIILYASLINGGGKNGLKIDICCA